MAFRLEIVDWRDSRGTSRSDYRAQTSLWKFLDGSHSFPTKVEAEAAAEQVWIEPDCNGVAPVCVVTETQ